MTADENAHYGFVPQDPSGHLQFSSAMSWPLQQHHLQQHDQLVQQQQQQQQQQQHQQQQQQHQHHNHHHHHHHHHPLHHTQPPPHTHHHHQPHDQHANLSASATMSPKRSTSPLPLALNTQLFSSAAVAPTSATFPGTAAAMAAAAAAVDWEQHMTSQSPPSVFIGAAPTYTESQPFDQYTFQTTSPTNYMDSQTGLDGTHSGAVDVDPSIPSNFQFHESYIDLHTDGVGAGLPNNINHLKYEMSDVGGETSCTDSGSMEANASDLSGSSIEHISINMELFPPNVQEIIPSPPQPSIMPMNSPRETVSVSDSDNSWCNVNPQQVFFTDTGMHVRSLSHSSSPNSDSAEQHSRASIDEFVDVSITNTASSPSTTNSTFDPPFETPFDHDPQIEFDMSRYSPPAPISVSTTSVTAIAAPPASPPAIVTQSNRMAVPGSVKPIAIRPQIGSSQSSASPPERSPTSPTARKQPRKTPAVSRASVTKPTSAGVRRQSHLTTGAIIAGKGEPEKRVGRRKGPLRPEQRKQACEIRKLGACIRCRFLKKTCDKGDPCGGCQPSHARLWLVPCTRIDIRDLGYFMKDWKADYERHVSLGFSVGNIKGFSDRETTLWITHGYGQYLPVQARQVHVRDDRVFGVNWVEARNGKPSEHEVDTAKLSAGMEGVSTTMLSDYLDRLIDNNFSYFVDEHFEGTPFVTDILKVAHRYWMREKTPVVRRALKFVLAYNLTQAVCMAKFLDSEDDGYKGEGLIEDDDSYYNGQTAAPVMINFQVKCAMADMWRELQKEILEELSTLYSSFYSKDKLKHWPTIFMLASILLIVWEEMQFDCRYRIPDAAVVEKFCNDMETTPVGVIVGLFSAISQKVPAFSEWDTSKHHTALNSNPAVCQAMEEVRENVTRYDKYLRNRSQAHYDRNDFDSLSNKFVSKLVIRAH